MRRFARYGWLPLLVLGMTGIAGLTVLAGLSMLEDRLVVRAGRDLQWAAMEIGAKLDLLLFERYGDMRVLAGTLQEMGSDDRGRRWTEHLQRVQQAYPIYAWIGVLDGAGRVVATTDPATLGLVADGTDRFRAPTGRPSAFMMFNATHGRRSGKLWRCPLRSPYVLRRAPHPPFREPWSRTSTSRISRRS